MQAIVYSFITQSIQHNLLSLLCLVIFIKTNKFYIPIRGG